MTGSGWRAAAIRAEQSMYDAAATVERAENVTDGDGVTTERFAVAYADVPCKLARQTDARGELQTSRGEYLLHTPPDRPIKKGDRVTVARAGETYRGRALERSFAYATHCETALEVKEV